MNPRRMDVSVHNVIVVEHRNCRAELSEHTEDFFCGKSILAKLFPRGNMVGRLCLKNYSFDFVDVHDRLQDVQQVWVAHSL